MEQLTQKLKDGAMQVVEVPVPLLRPGHVLVRTRYSLISAGTEGSTVQAARSSYLGKARARPKQVRQVMDTLRTQGPGQTWRAVMKRLEAHSPLGYSLAGEVIAADAETGFYPGDLVACGGLEACHAEVVCVPANLAVKLGGDADLRKAAYNTLGAIACQALRQADVRLGETCAVIGLGLLGQLCCLLLRAAGVRTVGVDVDPGMVELASGHCADLALRRETPGLERLVTEFSGGIGCDAVIIAASTADTDPVNLAGALCRLRGTVVVLGAVPTGFERDPHWYRKELCLKMSCSTGPGRYDPGYEEHGRDYPPGHVRWTENRNMQAFQELVAAGAVDPSYLTTHEFSLERAPEAYEVLLKPDEPSAGILLAYDPGRIVTRPPEPPPAPALPAPLGVSFVGAGSYAQGQLLPHLPAEAARRLVTTASGTTARSVVERFGFAACAPDAEAVLADPGTSTVFIATRHDSHADLVCRALETGRHVFVEKPLCLDPADLPRIQDAHAGAGALLTVGYNRRFSPLSRRLADFAPRGPRLLLCRVNAGALPGDSWVLDPERGGGRIVGEVCHFVDYFRFIARSPLTEVVASALDSETLTITLRAADGSLGAITYLAVGDTALPKERYELHAHGTSAVLDDFKTLTLYAGGKKRTHRLAVQDKGQRHLVKSFCRAVKRGGPPPIPAAEIFEVSRATFAVRESLVAGGPLRLEGREE